MPNQVLYGFHELKDIFTDRIVGNTIRLVDTAIQQAVEEHNRQLDALLGLFVERTTEPQLRYLQGANMRLQPLDDDGRARPVKVSGYYDVGFPLQSAGSAWGANYVTRAKMTVEDANRITASMLIADARWVRDHILAALFANAAWTFEDELYGNLTVRPLAITSDGITYQLATGADAGGTDQHLLAQANAIGAGADNPFPTIYTELTEHPENAGATIIALIPTGLKASVQALATFNPILDPNIRPGANSDALVGTLGVDVPGTVFGYEDSGVWLVEWPNMVANYIVAVAAGPNPRPLAMREDPEAELRGFQRVAERNDHPFYESQFLRRAGFGAWNRVGALAYRIGNGAYAVPTNYSSPMP